MPIADAARLAEIKARTEGAMGNPWEQVVPAMQQDVADLVETIIALREVLMNAVDVADQEATVAHASDATWAEIEQARAVWKATG